MTVQIVTDSTCDLPPAIIEALQIKVVPCYVHFEGVGYRDGIDLTREQFYQMLVEKHGLPTTAAPGLGAYSEVYSPILENISDAILSIHISSRLSNIYNSALLAAQSINPERIHLFDSGNLSLSTGLMVAQAARLAREGKTIQEILSLLEELRARTYSYARLDTLEYLRRGGRLNDIGQGIASMLDIKPIMKMNQGKPQMEIVRTRRRADQRVIELVRGLGELEQIGFVHANALHDVEKLMEAVQPWLPANTEILVSDVSPVIGAHVGPGAICVCAIAKKPLPESRSRVNQLVDKLRATIE
jgi:DegV family protein with EDD domain